MSTPDGFLRLPLAALRDTPLEHLFSGVDPDEPMQRCGSTTTICGYTEWVSAGEPAVSIGWDWSLQWRDGSVQLVRDGSPRTNVMVVDEARRDLGWDRSLDLLSGLVDTLAWRDKTRTAVAQIHAT